MIGKRWALTAVVALSVVSAGCTTCNHETCKPALDAGPRCDVPTCERQKVHVFLINGMTPGISVGLDGLRDKLAAEGFSKIGTGELIHTAWIASEMKRIAADNPDARFVLIGYDLGGGAAVRLAVDGVKAKVPVEAVVLLDPVGVPGNTTSGVHTMVICGGAVPSPLPHTESIVVPDAGHFRLPTHPQTVAAISRLLNNIAVRQWREEPFVISEWSYEHAPPLRMPSMSGVSPEWDILSEKPAGSILLPLGTTEATTIKRTTVATKEAVARIPKP